MKRHREISLVIAPFLLMSNLAFATTWYVNGVSGSDSNPCTSSTAACKTIGHAVALATSGDSIRIAPAIYAEHLTLAIDLKLIGSGASTTIIDGGGAGRVLTTSSNVTVSGLTVRNGVSRMGGGGIANSGTLTVVASTISGNTANIICIYGRICQGGGGGIVNTNRLTLTRSTIVGNLARIIYSYGCGTHMPCVVVGGGIWNAGTMVVTDSTFAGNRSGIGYGKGGAVANGGTAIISSSTLSGNSASSGGGIFGTVALQNTIVANSYGGNCSGTMSSNGYNLSSDNSCALSGPGDVDDTNPMLDVLGYYGGHTQTFRLLAGSPAIDAGDPAGCTDGFGNLLKTDQRGAPRPDTDETGGCDIGAYERQSD